MAVTSAEGSLPLITFFNPDKVITSLQIDLGEYLGSIDAIPHLVHKRERVPILVGNLIETSIIDTKHQSPPMRCWYEENRRPSRSLCSSNLNYAQHNV